MHCALARAPEAAAPESGSGGQHCELVRETHVKATTAALGADVRNLQVLSDLALLATIRQQLACTHTQNDCR